MNLSKMNPFKVSFVLLTFLFSSSWQIDSAIAQEKFTITEDDVVAFLGGTNMVRLQKSGDLESLITLHFAKEKPRFIDFSWEADTVYRLGTVIDRWRKGAYGDLIKQLNRFQTTKAILQFGLMESMEGKDELPRFVEAYNRLLDQVSRQTREIVLISPTPFEKPNSELVPDVTEHQESLAAYVEATRRIAKKRKLLFVDLFTQSSEDIKDNGIHVRPDDQAIIAQEIATQLKLSKPAPEALKSLIPQVQEKHRLWYDYWRAANTKLLYGDDSKRQFTKGGKNYIPFQEEWARLVPLIKKAEERIHLTSNGKKDPGYNRPKPEVLHGDPNADIEKELKAFKTLPGLKVNLFASEKEGLTSPLNLRWDPDGRMYVTVTTTYPHVWPGDVPNDKVILLEDTNWDGRADKSTVFVEGLNIPTGIELGDGGVYIGQGTELLFFKDTDGDGKADLRKLILSGFGNGDSHQTINSFIWSPGGELFFGQGDGIESRVETPWGNSDLFQAGFYQLRPKRLQLLPLLDDFMGPGNPWGVEFDDWGQIFSIDGAGGVTYLTPGLIPSKHKKRLGRIGNPGGYCGIGHVDGEHLPESLRGHFALGDFKANRIKRFEVVSHGSGFKLHWKEPILTSSHRNFRPVDVKMGPDGALYVVDWYNPIICHQDDAYRVPTRDKAHGRIWRVSSDRPILKSPRLTKAKTSEVLNSLKAKDRWTRNQAKRALTVRPAILVAKEIEKWVAGLDKKHADYEHHLYEALGAYETIEIADPKVLYQLLKAKDYRARAYATRVAGRWHDRMTDALYRLEISAQDPHPQVRLEAALALAIIPSPQAVTALAKITDSKMDGWLDYAFTQAVYQNRPYWKPALKKGELQFSSPRHLGEILTRVGDRDLVKNLRGIARDSEMDQNSRLQAIAGILNFGKPEELIPYGLDSTLFTQDGTLDEFFHSKALQLVLRSVQAREIPFSEDFTPYLKNLLSSKNISIQQEALRLIGAWKVKSLSGGVFKIAFDPNSNSQLTISALKAVAHLQPIQAKKLYLHILKNQTKPIPEEVRVHALALLLNFDEELAKIQTAAFLKRISSKEDRSFTHQLLVTALLNKNSGATVLSHAIETSQLSKADSESLLKSVYSIGRSDKHLVSALIKRIGLSKPVPKFNSKYLNSVVNNSKKLGNALRGKLIFENSEASCLTCHKVGNRGGMVGPELTSIGTTLAIDRITEELLWPNRQVKEGYTLIKVITNDGTIHQGYERTSRKTEKSGDTVLRELESDTLFEIPKNKILSKTKAGSSMPEGITTTLTDQQVYDLLKYLSGLGA